MKKLNFRTKSFILFILFSILLKIFLIFSNNYTSSFIEKLQLIVSISDIILYFLYGAAIYFFFKYKFWSWVFGLLASLWTLFDPLTLAAINDVTYPLGSVLATIYAIKIGDTLSALMFFLESLFYLMVSIYCIINIITSLFKFENKVFDLFIGIIFSIFASIKLSGIIENLIIQHSIMPLQLIKGMLIVFLYIIILILWQKEMINRLLKPIKNPSKFRINS